MSGNFTGNSVFQIWQSGHTAWKFFRYFSQVFVSKPAILCGFCLFVVRKLLKMRIISRNERHSATVYYEVRKKKEKHRKNIVHCSSVRSAKGAWFETGETKYFYFTQHFL